MPSIQTRDFGPVEYDASAELRFPLGLPGFERQTRFILIEREAMAPLVFLQSAETESLCFITVPVQAVDPGYQIGMTEEDQRSAGLEQAAEGDLLSLAILSAAVASGGRVTANLLAPVVINLKTKTAVQAVRPDTRYSHQHPLPEAVSCV